MHPEIFQMSDLKVPPIEDAAHEERETTMMAALPPAPSTGSALRTVVSIYLSRFCYWLQNRLVNVERALFQERLQPE